MIAHREIHRADGTVVTFDLTLPQQVSGAGPDTWFCTVISHGRPEGDIDQGIYGVDSLQAVALAAALVERLAPIED